MFDNNNNNPSIGLYQTSVWIDNVVQVFQNKSIPLSFDLLSVDTDFNDFWNLRAIMLGGYRPRVVIVEASLFPINRWKISKCEGGVVLNLRHLEPHHFFVKPSPC